MIRPCQNGGTCTQVSATQYTCSCFNGYSGTNCEISMWQSNMKIASTVNKV